MRWLLGTFVTLAAAGAWIALGAALGVSGFLIGHFCGVICAAGATLSCGGRLWAADD